VGTHFILQIYFIKVLSQLLLLVFRNSRNGNNTSLCCSCLWKLWKYYPRFIRVLIVFFTKPHLAMSNLWCKLSISDLIYFAMLPHLISNIIWKFWSKYEDAPEHHLSCYQLLWSIQDHTSSLSSSSQNGLIQYLGSN
jgi:hypothetical protein